MRRAAPPGASGSDFFAGFNVTAIVLEVPTEDIADDTDNVGVWAFTKLKGHQIDRIGRPAINTVLISTSKKDDFNEGKPRKDVKDFTDEVVASLKSSFFVPLGKDSKRDYSINRCPVGGRKEACI